MLKYFHSPFPDGSRRPPSNNSNKFPSPSLDSVFHRDKDPSTTEKHDLKPESEKPQESSTKKKDASHRETLVDSDDTKNHTSDSSVDKDRIEPTTATDDSAVQNVTKRPGPEESTKKINKHPSSKENKINGVETSSTFHIATDHPAHSTNSARRPEPSKTVATTNGQGKVTKPSGNEEKVTAASKVEQSTVEASTVLKTATKTFSTSTLNIETSSTVQVIESTSTRIAVRPTATITESNADTKSSLVSLEPSKTSDVEYTTSTSGISTPTDGLPSSYPKSSTVVEKSTVQPTISTTFTKGTFKEIFTLKGGLRNCNRVKR